MPAMVFRCGCAVVSDEYNNYKVTDVEICQAHLQQFLGTDLEGIADMIATASNPPTPTSGSTYTTGSYPDDSDAKTFYDREDEALLARERVERRLAAKCG